MVVLPSNRPRYIEEFWSGIPDWANNDAPDGDADWLPAFRRACYEHIVDNRSYQRPILVGDTLSRYELRGKLDLYGIRLEGLYPGVEMFFSQGTDGIHIHSGGTSLGVYPPGMIGKGGDCTLRNLHVVGNGAEGTRGIIVQRVSTLDQCRVTNFGWHGIHVTADVRRGPEDIDGGNSNASGTHLDRCTVYDCGDKPGCDSRLVSEANPAGRREWGCGLKIQGGDANICTTDSFHAVNCAGWAIHDAGFLGNTHTLPDTHLCGHTVEEWEPETYGVPVGERINLAYCLSGASARGLLISPYVESMRPTSIVDVRPPSFVIGGIGGAKQPQTRTVGAGVLAGIWKAEATDKSASITLGEGAGTALSVSAPADGPIRFKYVPFVDDDPANSEASNAAAGLWKLDLRNLNSAVYLSLTGSQSYEKTSGRALIRKLDPGRVVLATHYRAGGGATREQLYGMANTIAAIESAYPAANKQRGDAYTCLAPVVGGVHTAVVVEEAGVKRWATTGMVQ